MKWHGSDLCYCQNIHPGDTWQDNLNAIKIYTLQVKKQVCPNAPFGLGLRLSADAARELSGQLDEFKTFLKKHDLYVFTINGFPYGRFHGAKIKDAVYQPGWEKSERLEYTILLADILIELLPDGCEGSISTVPLCYGKHKTPEMTENILQAARHLACIYSKTGKTIVLGLEPEPDCCLETTQEVIGFIKEIAGLDSEAGQFAGVCVDTCHLALQQENLLKSVRTIEREGVRIAKIQLSSALEYRYDGRQKNQLQSFNDPVYLHQTRIFTDNGVIKFRDLPEAFDENPQGKWLVHFHVPLYYGGEGVLSSTTYLLNNDFIKNLKTREYHLEIETYSFSQLPCHDGTVVESIVKEFFLICDIQ